MLWDTLSINKEIGYVKNTMKKYLTRDYILGLPGLVIGLTLTTLIVALTPGLLDAWEILATYILLALPKMVQLVSQP